jgi:hypothetical protein
VFWAHVTFAASSPNASRDEKRFVFMFVGVFCETRSFAGHLVWGLGFATLPNKEISINAIAFVRQATRNQTSTKTPRTQAKFSKDSKILTLPRRALVSL